MVRCDAGEGDTDSARNSFSYDAPVLSWVIVSVDTIEGLIMGRLMDMPNIHNHHLIISMGEFQYAKKGSPTTMIESQPLSNE